MNLNYFQVTYLSKLYVSKDRLSWDRWYSLWFDIHPLIDEYNLVEGVFFPGGMDLYISAKGIEYIHTFVQPVIRLENLKDNQILYFYNMKELGHYFIKYQDTLGYVEDDYYKISIELMTIKEFYERANTGFEQRLG